MSQKIKITATLANNHSEQSMQQHQDEVEYQWRWARVFAALFLVVTLLVVVTFYLFPTDSSMQQLADNTQLQRAVKTQGMAVSPVINEVEETEKVELSQSKVEAKQGSVEFHGELESNNKEARPTVTQEIVLPIDELTSQNQSDDQALPNRESAPEEAKQTAELADVALGAKMDTKVVSRALLSREIKAREPVDIIGERIARASFTKKLYFFTEVKGLKGETVRHKWYFQDQLQADVALSVYAERYRTYSSKNIAALQLGVWRVELIAGGVTLASKQFIVTDQ